MPCYLCKGTQRQLITEERTGHYRVHRGESDQNKNLVHISYILIEMSIPIICSTLPLSLPPATMARQLF